MGKRWTEISSGALKRDESQSESQMLQNVLEWARGAGMEVPSFKRERVEREKDFVKVTFRATGTGTMNQIGKFLWRIQTASVPVRITDVSITSKKEGTDDLSVQLGIATIYLTAEAEKKDNKAASASAAREMWQ
jgi:Tfp pilus assembly protein PilO